MKTDTSSNFSRGKKKIDSTESIDTTISISSKHLNSLDTISALEYIGSKGSLAIWWPTGSDSL